MDECILERPCLPSSSLFCLGSSLLKMGGLIVESKPFLSLLMLTVLTYMFVTSP